MGDLLRIFHLEDHTVQSPARNYHLRFLNNLFASTMLLEADSGMLKHA